MQSKRHDSIRTLAIPSTLDTSSHHSCRGIRTAALRLLPVAAVVYSKCCGRSHRTGSTASHTVSLRKLGAPCKSRSRSGGGPSLVDTQYRRYLLDTLVAPTLREQGHCLSLAITTKQARALGRTTKCRNKHRPISWPNLMMDDGFAESEASQSQLPFSTMAQSQVQSSGLL